MKFGFAIPAYGSWIDRAKVGALIQAGEELGFESVWWPDHIAVPDYGRDYLLAPPFLEPLAACGWGLGRTRRIRFGTDVLVAPYRHPLHVAAMRGPGPTSNQVGWSSGSVSGTSAANSRCWARPPMSNGPR